MSETYPWEQYPLHELEAKGIVTLGRGNIISKKDIQSNPGGYPIYSSSAKGEGLFGTYGDYMFDEEMITWSVDGGGNLFHRPRHKFSVTNVSGYMRLDTSVLDYRFAHAALALQHSKLTFDYQTKAHPSVIRNLYHLPIPPLPEQKKIAEILSGIDRAIAIYEKQAKVLANMLDALMQEEIVMNTSTKWIKVGDACTAQAGGTPDRSQKGYYEGRIPWVKSGEVKGEDIFQTDESISNEAIFNSSVKIVPSGSVLVAMYGATAGQTARLGIDATTNQAVLSLNSKTRELSNDYLYHSVTAFKNQLLLACQGSGQPNLSSGLIKELEIPLPDPLVQQRISSALDSVRHRVLALRSKINSSKSLKNSIASDLLSGRKRVSV